MLIEAAPGIAGWSYSTWKRAANDKLSPCPLAMPAEWKAVAPWVTGGVCRSRPSADAMARGTGALLRTVADERCRPEPASWPRSVLAERSAVRAPTVTKPQQKSHRPGMNIP